MDALAAMLTATGAEGTGEPYNTSYGRELVHVDLDHNLVRFVSPAPTK